MLQVASSHAFLQSRNSTLGFDHSGTAAAANMTNSSAGVVYSSGSKAYGSHLSYTHRLDDDVSAHQNNLSAGDYQRAPAYQRAVSPQPETMSFNRSQRSPPRLPPLRGLFASHPQPDSSYRDHYQPHGKYETGYAAGNYSSSFGDADSSKRKRHPFEREHEYGYDHENGGNHWHRSSVYSYRSEQDKTLPPFSSYVTKQSSAAYGPPSPDRLPPSRQGLNGDYDYEREPYSAGTSSSGGGRYPLEPPPPPPAHQPYSRHEASASSHPPRAGAYLHVDVGARTKGTSPKSSTPISATASAPNSATTLLSAHSTGAPHAQAPSRSGSAQPSSAQTSPRLEGPEAATPFTSTASVNLTDSINLQRSLRPRLDSREGTPACDECRRRKVKCDRKAPCSRCIASKRECKTSDTLMRRGPLTRQQKEIFASSGIAYESHRERMKKKRLLSNLAWAQQAAAGGAGDASGDADTTAETQSNGDDATQASDADLSRSSRAEPGYRHGQAPPPAPAPMPAPPQTSDIAYRSAYRLPEPVRQMARPVDAYGQYDYNAPPPTTGRSASPGPQQDVPPTSHYGADRTDRRRELFQQQPQTQSLPMDQYADSRRSYQQSAERGAPTRYSPESNPLRALYGSGPRGSRSPDLATDSARHSSYYGSKQDDYRH